MEKKKCPNCGSYKTKEYIYGYPPTNYDQENFILGGDVLYELNPKYYCDSCQCKFGQIATDRQDVDFETMYNLKTLIYTEDDLGKGYFNVSFNEVGETVEIDIRKGQAFDNYESNIYKINQEKWASIKEDLVNKIFIFSWPDDNKTKWHLNYIITNGKRFMKSGGSPAPYRQEFIEYIEKLEDDLKENM